MRFYRYAEALIYLRIPDTVEYQTTPIVIKGLRVSFTITKKLGWGTNPATIKIWNLSADHRNAINNFGDRITIVAGYLEAEENGALQILYTGETIAVSHIFEQPDIVSVFECGDGDRYLNNSRVAVSFSAETPVRTIIQNVANQMGIEFVEFADSVNVAYQQGFSNIGTSKDALANLCTRLNLQFSVQNNQLQIIPIDGTVTRPPVEINQTTGMQGVPQRYTRRLQDTYEAANAPRTGYKVRTMLNPLILPGYPVVLTSSHLGINKANFRVESLTHDGDTFGPIWSTQLDMTEIA